MNEFFKNKKVLVVGGIGKEDIKKTIDWYNSLG